MCVWLGDVLPGQPFALHPGVLGEEEPKWIIM